MFECFILIEIISFLIPSCSHVVIYLDIFFEATGILKIGPETLNMSLCDRRDQCIKQKMCLDVFVADFVKKAEILKAFSNLIQEDRYSMAATMQTNVERETVATGGFFFCFSAFKGSK